MPDNAKALKGFGSADVIELIESDSAGTYRAVYTVKMADFVYMLHVFQKKSKQGIKTPQADIDLVHKRLKIAEEDYKERLKREKK
jgi:phage-related protein